MLFSASHSAVVKNFLFSDDMLFIANLNLLAVELRLPFIVNLLLFHDVLNPSSPNLFADNSHPFQPVFSQAFLK